MTQVIDVTVLDAPAPIAVTVEDAAGSLVNLTVDSEPTPITIQVGPEAGPPGPAGSGATEFTFPTPAATWTIHHGLGRHPTVQLIDTTGGQFDGDVEFPDLLTVVVTHAQPTAGTAQLI
jgi:hypothetical protein